VRQLRAADRVILIALVGLAAAGLIIGWWAFWFLCDDAFIAFRYVSSSQLDLGYTWNPPPFRPVEGYTSLLWVALLDTAWTVTGAEPPESANWLSLGFSLGSLGWIVWMALRFDYGPLLERQRPLLLGLVLLGVVSNRTFLAFTSSGLETALFTFLLLGWCAIGLCAEPSRRAVTTLAWLALALALCRPDGLLFALFTVGLGGLWIARSDRRRGDGLALAPLLGIAAHLLWRRATYGFWLPNTYAAKHVAAWPDAGLRYVASFALEYAFWFWGLLALGVGVAALIRGGLVADRRRLFRAGVVVVFVAHAGYYTLLVGGDHFEYRIYHHIVPLVLLSFPWLWARLGVATRLAPAALAVMIAAGSVIPWTHWAGTHEFDNREQTFRLAYAVAPHLPSALAWYAAPFDDLQAWLIGHSICRRHVEHREFWRHQIRNMPSREQGLALPADNIPVYASGIVGVPGWTLPRVAIIDKLGLNDAVVARNVNIREREDGLRRMAHDRRPPPGYVKCFAPNVKVRAGRVRIEPRVEPLDPDDVIRCETRFMEQVLRDR